jgi:glycerate 2-kinase
MRIVIAPDSFKESASAIQIAKAMDQGVKLAMPEAETTLIPMADGGEGTCEAFVAACDAKWIDCQVSGPLCETVNARYALDEENETAVIEMAAASGMALLSPHDRDPMLTTTRGVGELIIDALDKGVKHIVVGLGGSATTDGGAGMAQALGISLLNRSGKEIAPGGQHLKEIEKIDISGRHPKLDRCTFIAACDVSNPLAGPSGAARVFALQKGATESNIITLDHALQHFGKKLEEQLQIPVARVPGAGAAGGLGAGLMAFTNAKLQRGIDIVAQFCDLESHIKKADLVLTGEGKLDDQSINGKTPVGIAAIAKKYNVPTIAIAGTLGSGYAVCLQAGITAAFSICQRPMSKSDAMREVELLVTNITESIIRLWTHAL